MRTKNYIVHWLMVVMVNTMLLPSQQNVWLKLERGEAVVLDPLKGGWQPIVERYEISRRTFVLSKEKSIVNVFVATEMYPIQANSYVFIDDAIAKSRSQLVAELTRIEVEQLPNSEQRPDSLETISVGLTYGKIKPQHDGAGSVPFKSERLIAVNSFITSGRNDAAVLTLKRMLARYPSLYFERPIVEQLFSLYEKLELDGFLFDESSRLLGLIQNDDYSRIVKEWNSNAKRRLTQTDNR